MIFSFPKEKTVLILVTASMIRFPDSLYAGSVSFPNDPIYFVLNFFPKYEIGAVATTSKVNAQLAEKAIANPETRADKFYILKPIIVEVRF